MEKIRNTWLTFAVVLVLFGCTRQKSADEFRSNLPDYLQRVWIGPEYWTNPLQDWQLNQGRIECVTSGGGRNVFLLTHRLARQAGTVMMSIRLGELDPNEQKLDTGWVGFNLGIRGEFRDYRDDAVRGVGYPVGITTGGKLFIGGLEPGTKSITLPLKDVLLKLTANPEGETYRIKLGVYRKDGSTLSEISRKAVHSDWLNGGVGLVCSRGKIPSVNGNRPQINDGNWGLRPGTQRGGNVRFWFSDWRLRGTKVEANSSHIFGPVLAAEHTLSKGILKMTAQMPPVGEKDPQKVRLEIKGDDNNAWRTAGEAEIDPLSRTATFRVENWKSDRNVPYRLLYGPLKTGSGDRTFFYNGTIRKEPWDKEEFVVAAFTGNNDLGFPNDDIVKQIKYHDPDLLFFSGDQIYEGVGGFGTQRKPTNKAVLDYLRKWYLYCWAYGDLMRDRPVVSIPDDHDVYHGNLWGAGGKAAPPGLSGYAAQDAGGYKMPPEWVNMVQRTQTSHLPDAFDPTPVKQGIGVYYCDLKYAGISFAILEDRKFKSAPKPLLPEGDIENGWSRNRNFNAKTQADAPGAVLLGNRQLSFLRDWAADWSGKTWMKVALSQTIFANVATLPREEATSDKIVPKLRILKADEYPPDDIPVADMDSDGWPQSGRNRAVSALRRASALHIAGDQHLGSFIQYGVKDWNDAGFAFCVPAISNVWPRRWYPEMPGKNPKPGAPRYTGEFEDGFGNKITVFAVSNPVFTGLKPSRLYDRATGYGIVRFNRNSRDITVECWPRLSDPSKPGAREYPGWPVTMNQFDNYYRNSEYVLPPLKITGMSGPVVQIVNETTDQIELTVRIKGQEFQPRVPKGGSYRIGIGEPGSDKWEEISGLKAAVKGSNQQPIQINL